MKRFFTTLFLLVLVGVSMFAQAPEKFTYQAVVRNATNNLVINSPVGVRVSILQGGVNGTLVYMETQSAVTNANGLITLQIGGGNVQQGNFADIDWAGGSYFLKTETDPNGGNDYSITSTQQLLSVPYALYAKEAANGFSGDYNDLVNKPALFSGNYNDLTNKPTIPTVNNATLTIQKNGSNVGTFTANQNTNQIVNITVPTMTSQLANNSGFITNEALPTNVSQLNNDAGYITAAQCGDVDICALASQLAQMQQQMAQMQARLDSLEWNTFTCGTSTVTDHEGNVYATVQIGNQCWMRDNLRTTTSPSTGTYLIPAANANYTYTGKQARWYNNDSATYAPMNYGLLYNWNAAVDTFNTSYGETSVNTSLGNAVSVTFSGHRRGICPAGWHLPSHAEWTQLTDYVSSQSEYTCGGDSSFIAKALASAEGWNTHTNNCAVGNDPSLNNATGFSAVPAGHCIGSSFDFAGYYVRFWSATQHASLPGPAYDRYLRYDNAGVDRGGDYKYRGRSVRCLRD